MLVPSSVLSGIQVDNKFSMAPEPLDNPQFYTQEKREALRAELGPGSPVTGERMCGPHGLRVDCNRQRSGAVSCEGSTKRLLWSC